MNRWICVRFMGGLGNHLHAYSFARAYAEKHNATLYTQPWIGQRIFAGVNDSSIPDAIWHDAMRRPVPMDSVPWGETNITLNGYYQRQECINLLSRKKLREWFAFRPEVIAQYSRFHGDWHTAQDVRWCAMHLRHGDYLKFADIYAVIAQEAYIKAYDAAGCDEPITWVSEQQGGTLVGDFLALAQADVLFRANSTFSWWAATLGKEGQRVFAPKIEGKAGGPRADIDFIEGNWPRCADLPNVTDLHVPD